ncbi:hypothetical protein LMG26685_02264 [Achromobacter mucicolens]|uniref:hypothetical protein n=1 Tax=Achromobacter mucicolens TaxID=1389922 RepID=UPI001466BF51|nr:hypothetical protein [Achromobacter mucicolens]WBX90427.1 hypothetical protein PE062_07290 [Achromobacter mucicolens]CAB3644579.1 hypothetical protein LMG26685_02264 [Achromobacter mucicolens]
MTATPPDPLATQHDGTPDPDGQGPADTRTQRLQEENRALRELLAAQVHASLPRQDPGWVRRLGWWLISAPGAALVGWRSLFGRDDGEPITRRSVGCAAVTVIYTLAIYGALVLLVVSWNSPNTATSGSTAASPVRVPLTPQPTQPPESDAANKRAAPSPEGSQEEKATDSSSDRPAPNASSSAADRPETNAASSASNQAASASSAPDHADGASSTSDHAAPAAASAEPARAAASPSSSEHAPTGPQPSLRITVIPAPDPMAWVAALDGELERCAELGFFERPECAWAARKQFCEPNQGWGKVKECPAQP